MLKCLVELDYFNLFIRKISSDYDSIAEFLGFYDICDSLSSYHDDKRAYKSKILSLCADKFCALQKLQKQGKFGSHKVLHSNLCLLKETLGLNHIEFALLELIAIVEEVPALREFLSIFDKAGRRKNILIISQMLDCPYKEIATALHKDSILKKCVSSKQSFILIYTLCLALQISILSTFCLASMAAKKRLLEISPRLADKVSFQRAIMPI